MKRLLVLVCMAVLLAHAKATEGETLGDFFHFMRILSKPQIPHRYKSVEIKDVEKRLVGAMSQNPNAYSSVLKFDWSNCGSAGDLSRVRSLSIGPDPIHIPGKVIVSAGIDLHSDIGNGSDITASIQVEKKILFWITIPCVDNFGSCTYNNVCELDPYRTKTCPPDFIKNKIPCKCPFTKGTYNVANMAFTVKDPSSIPSWLTSGDYKITAHLATAGKQIACINMQLSLS